MERVAITGCGVASAIGIGFDDFCNSLMNQNSANPSSRPQADSKTDMIAREINASGIEEHLDTDSLRRLGKTTIFSILAGKLALEDAGITLTEANSFDAGFIMGSHYGEFRSQIESHQKVFERKVRLVPPNRFLYVVPNTIGGEVCTRLKIRGYNCFLYDAEVSSALSIVMAYQRLRHDAQEKYYLAGGADSVEENLVQWHQMAHTTKSKKGNTESNNGLVIGEGSGMVVLERLCHAQKRQARIHCQICGCGVSSAAPARKTDAGAYQAIKTALKQGGLRMDDIGALVLDLREEIPAVVATIDRLLPGKEGKIPTTSITALTGETFGASGAFSLIAGIAILQSKVIFPVAHPTVSLSGLVRKARQLKKKHILIYSTSRTRLRSTSAALILAGD